MKFEFTSERSKALEMKAWMRKWKSIGKPARCTNKKTKNLFARKRPRCQTSDGGASLARHPVEMKSVFAVVTVLFFMVLFITNRGVTNAIFEPVGLKLHNLVTIDWGLFLGANQKINNKQLASLNCQTPWSTRWSKSKNSQSDFLLDTVTTSTIRRKSRAPMEWIKFPVILNETQLLLRQLLENGSCKCHNMQTIHYYVVGFPKQEGLRPVRLIAGPIHEFQIVSVGADGHRRCGGGDFYEADLSAMHWKSRPLVLDNNDGTYNVKMQVDPRFIGYYSLKIVHLFHNYHAFDPLLDEEYCTSVWPEKCGKSWLKDVEFVLLPPAPPPPPLALSSKMSQDSQEPSMEGFPSIATTPSTSRVPSLARPQELKVCEHEDYKLKQWSGRWTRDHYNETCKVNSDGRFQCLAVNTECASPWCNGPIDKLDSNGWVYSAHCIFKIFSQEEAWKCLDGKWIFWWGDSQHQDTISNLLNFVLGCRVSLRVTGRGGIGRKDDRTYFRSEQQNSSSSTNDSTMQTGQCQITKSHEEGIGQRVRFTNLFNGHEKIYEVNNHGLSSLKDEIYKKEIRRFFAENTTSPDVVIMNSGLHDGCYWPTTQSFVEEGLELGAKFWKGIFDNILPKHPRIIYHTTVAVAGNARLRGFNPHKMEVYNKLMVERLQKLNLSNFWIADGYDLTFPWHFDHECSDGPHYGMHPSKRRAVDGQFVHKYFVDVMLVHILLNSICQK